MILAVAVVILLLSKPKSAQTAFCTVQNVAYAVPCHQHSTQPRQAFSRGRGSMLQQKQPATLGHVQLFVSVLTVREDFAAGTYRMLLQQLRTGP